MNIEDLLFQLSLIPNFSYSLYESNLVYSLCEQINKGLGLTEKQRTLAVRTLFKYVNVLEKHMNRNVILFLKNPTYNLPIRIFTSNKTMTIVDHPIWDKLIKVAFPYNDDILTEIKLNKQSLGYATWHMDERVWEFSLEEINLVFLSVLAKKHNFTFDTQLTEYFKRTEEILGNIESFVPMLTLDNNIPKLINVSKYIPNIETTDVLGAIFEARKYGINTWDDKIDQYLNTDLINTFTRRFLKNNPAEPFTSNATIDQLSDIIKYASPTLVIIPGGLELETTTNCYNFLSSIGLTHSEISVLFRLPNQGTGITLNQYIKDNQLNNPISEMTKAIFISCKFPKTIIKSKIKFNSVINLGENSAHYTTRYMVDGHENLIYLKKERTQLAHSSSNY